MSLSFEPPIIELKDSEALTPIRFKSLDVEMELKELSKTKGELFVRSKFSFSPIYDGKPVFLLNPSHKLTSIKFQEIEKSDDFVYDFTMRSQDHCSPIVQLKVVNEKTTKDSLYTLEISHAIPINISFINPLGFKIRMRDVYLKYSTLEELGLLDKYFPSNFEFDQFPCEFKIMSPQGFQVISNAEDTLTTSNNVQVLSFPSYFNSSCHFIEIFNNNYKEFKLFEERYNFKSITNYSIPIHVYGDKDILSEAKTIIFDTLEYMEHEIGPYPHKSLTCVVGNVDSQEYAGALSSEMKNLKHEIIHQWFGRAILSCNGNSGWIDEAISSWLENKTLKIKSEGIQNYRLSGFHPYMIYTTYEAYSYGRQFIYEVNELSPTRFKKFLKILFQEYKFKTLTHSIFIRDLIKVMGPDNEKTIIVPHA